MSRNLIRRLSQIAPKAARLERLIAPKSAFDYSPLLAMHQSPQVDMRRPKTRRVLPAVLMRAGTSKGLFLHRRDLPSMESEWAAPLLAAMGSQNPDPKQIDGIGGGTSTTSKIAVVSPSSRPGVDVDYTFIQVGVGKRAVDFSGNCGNMAAGVAPFAIQERLVRSRSGQQRVSLATQDGGVILLGF